MTKVIDQIIFDKSAKQKILNYFKKEVDERNIIVDSKNKKKVLTLYGEELHIDDFGGIFVGSEIYVKSDLASIVKFLQRTSQNDSP